MDIAIVDCQAAYFLGICVCMLRYRHGAQKPCPICEALTSCCIFQKEWHSQNLVACAVSMRSTARRGVHLRCARPGDQSRTLHLSQMLTLQASQMQAQVAKAELNMCTCH